MHWFFLFHVLMWPIGVRTYKVIGFFVVDFIYDSVFGSTRTLYMHIPISHLNAPSAINYRSF
jgi:hypothetical protein